ncbi:uncharacterized protein LOC128213734 isoform X3 [Mya arenaria]|uniref:uncharacterized protein LOC128213734 isoform X3 n=1 Tax=Mya arenaria TaxID=6604 RepID=UPI0022DEDEF2|nr:uncharacterized protein LOC128213734 isoform X3 [Mya arenaria]
MDRKEGKKKGKRSKIGVINDNFEMEEASTTIQNKVSPFLNNIRDAQAKNNNTKSKALENLVHAKKSVSRWREYVNKKRKKKKSSGDVWETVTSRSIEGNTPRVTGQDSQKNDEKGALGLDDIHEDFVSGKDKLFGNKKTMSSASNRALMQYFAKLGRSESDEFIDLEFVESLLQNGADINCTDKHGQTLLHEVASKWHIDVAKFLIENGADANKPDAFGRTPLHVAAADNYPDMVNLLIDSGAEKEAKTYGENQTAVHYAARNDAIDSLKTLIKRRCEYKMVMDYKGRTPLHVAAQLDRSETSRLLLDLEAPVGLTDNKGQAIMTWMITKMPPVALEALGQLHVRDRPNRKQYFHLNALMNDKAKDPGMVVQIPLQVAVRYKQFDILMNQVFLTLMNMMWIKFARWRAYGGLFFNFSYILLWTVYGVVIEYDKRHDYVLPEQWWRIILIIAAVGITMWQIVDEIREYRRSSYLHSNYQDWREKEIEEDLKFCHPRWPEERLFLENELENVRSSHTNYLSDMWNWFDWICYTLLLAVIGTHIADIISHTDQLARHHIRLTAVVIIFLWLRLMKNIRAFALLGPFVVMLGTMAQDLLKFAFLYFEFYIPYLCAFWMIFGGTKFPMNDNGTVRAENVTVPGFEKFNDAMFTMWRMTLVDEYAYEDMVSIDNVMAPLLVATWLFLSAVLCLNLLIALFSDTFQRVYDNAKANAVMQKCIMILSFWEGMSNEARFKFMDFISNECSPFKDDYDDDMTDTDGQDLQKVTIQIKEELDEMKRRWHDQFGDEDDKTALEELVEEEEERKSKNNKMVTTAKFENELDGLRDALCQGLTLLQQQQDQMMNQFKREMKMVKSLLLDLHGGVGGPGSQGGDGGPGYGMPYTARGGYAAPMGQMVPQQPQMMPMAGFQQPLDVGQDERMLSARRRRKKSKTTLDTGNYLDAQLPGEINRGIFAPSPLMGQPAVEVATQDPEDPYQVDISSSARLAHDPDSIA